MTCLDVQLDPYRHVVRGLFAAAHMGVYLTICQQVSGLGRQQKVVNPDAVIAVVGARLVIPKRVLFGGRVARTKRLCQAKGAQFAKFGTAFKTVKRIIRPGRRVSAVFGLRDNVVITGHQKRHILA